MVPIIIRRDATIYSLFISVNCSTCFGWYLHPSSGAHVTVSTASGVSKTVTATFRERDWTGTEFLSDTVIWAPDDGWRYHPKHVEQFTVINKLYIVASRINYWHIFTMHGLLNVEWNMVLLRYTLWLWGGGGGLKGKLHSNWASALDEEMSLSRVIARM
jgi:hypothetical protein